MPGRERGGFLYRLADLVEEHSDELAALEALDNGKSLSLAKAVDAPAWYLSAAARPDLTVGRVLQCCHVALLGWVG